MQALELRKAFDNMDTNKDGVVTKDELITLLKSLGEFDTDEAVDELIKVVDLNVDGKVQFEEFVKASTQGDIVKTWHEIRYSSSIMK